MTTEDLDEQNVHTCVYLPTPSVTFLSAVSKHLTKGNLGEGKLHFALQFEGKPIMVGKHAHMGVRMLAHTHRKFSLP